MGKKTTKQRQARDAIKEAIPRIERQFNYKFRNKALLAQALYENAVSVTDDGVTRMVDNDSLEFIGDSILYTINMMETNLDYNNPTIGKSSGFYIGPSSAAFAKRRISQTSNKRLCDLMNMSNLKFIKELLLTKKQKNQPNAKFWADTFEAIIGAIGVDCGFDMNVVFNSYESGKFTVQGKGLLKYIESKENLNQKAVVRRHNELVNSTGNY